MSESTASDIAHEEGILRFLLPSARTRAEQIMRGRHRQKWTSTLAHANKFDSRWLLAVKPADHDAPAIERHLVARGAPPRCWVVSENRSWDAREWLLPEALNTIIGAGYGAIVSCVPGELAYFEGEGPGNRNILSRTT